MCIKDKGPIGLNDLISHLNIHHSESEVKHALIHISSHSMLKVQGRFGGKLSAAEKIGHIDEIYSDEKIKFLAKNFVFGKEQCKNKNFVVNKCALFHRLYLPKFVYLADDLFGEDRAGLLIKFVFLTKISNF